MPAKESTQEKVKRLFEEYKLVLETQMHFNDMLMKYRSLAFTIIPALGGIAVIILKELTSVSVASWFVLMLISVWLGVFLVDFCYYFRMLLGAVERSTEIEKEVAEKGFSPSFLGVTKKINHKIKPFWAGLIIILFYAIPLIVGIILFFFLRLQKG